MSAYKDITNDDLARMGVNSVAYIRKRVVDNKDFWYVYAAEGTELARTDDEQTAVSLVLDNELMPVSVQ